MPSQTSGRNRSPDKQIQFIYPMYAGFPSATANVLQRINTSYELVATGLVKVHIIHPATQHQPERDILAYYGLTPHPHLHFHSIVLGGSRAAPVRKLRSLGVVFFALLLVLKNTLVGRQVVLFGRDVQYISPILRAVKLLGGRVVFESHGIDSIVWRHRGAKVMTSTKASYIRREQFVLRHADRVIATTTNLKKILVQDLFISENRITVVPNGARDEFEESSPQKNKLELPENKFIVTYTGNSFLSEKYDLSRIIDAIVQLPNDIAILFVGGSRLQDVDALKKYALQNHLADRVYFTGHVTPVEARRYQRQADVLLLYGQTDDIEIEEFTSPIKMFEYMATCKPILAPNIKMMREVLEHGRNAWLYEPDLVGLVESIIYLKSNPELCQTIAAKARQDFLNCYTWQHRAKRILTAINSLFEDTEM